MRIIISSRKFNSWFFLALLATCLFGCGKEPAKNTTAIAETQAVQKPNILWLVVEDMSPILSVYGDNTVATPNITKLAEEGIRYTNVYSPSGVCAPSRAALATGMYPSAIAANHMRTKSHTEVTGLPKYEALPPVGAKMLSQYLREHGYYATNNIKTDYQFTEPKSAWDESSYFAHWRDRPEGKPFFSIMNFTTTHESGLFEPYGVREIEKRHYFSGDRKRIAALPQHHSVKSAEEATPIHIPKDTPFTIPPYLPDTELVRRDMWKMYNNLVETDRQIGAVLQQLKDDGLYDNTIIFFYADHGGPVPRQKRLIYDSGLKVPLIIRFPKALQAGSVDDQLISFVDFTPTTMALAGLSAPNHMHGRDFLSDTENQRSFIHAAADRFDGFTDTIRAVKDKRYKYIRNYRPEQGYYLPIVYREKIPTMQELLRLRDEGQLNDAQAQWFRESKPVEELFDTVNDPHELNNLVDDPSLNDTLNSLRAEMDRWLSEIGDTPNLEESELVKTIWGGQSVQPKTAMPTYTVSHGKVTLASETEGATISYQWVSLANEKSRELAPPKPWFGYTEALDLKEGKELHVVAHRLGYRESDVLRVDFGDQL